MKSLSRLPLILLGAVLATGAAAATTAASPAAAAPLSMKVHDLASMFAQVWDRNVGKADEEFLRDFKASVVPKFPAFYGVERYNGKKTEAQRDAEILKARAEFPALREAYAKKVARFTQDLPVHLASFKAVFPDYVPNDIWFVHSLGEMDGGKRTFKGKSEFIFGADQMVKLHGNNDETFFFHHELFHDYQPMQCKSWPVWTSLWQEGMASYVAKVLNPNATDGEMLLDLPVNMVPDTQKQMKRALDDLYAKLDSTDQEAYSGLFLRRGDNSGMPARRGYYLGMLVAEEAAKTMSLQQMARLDCDSVRPVVFAAVERLRSAQAAGGKRDE
ncbi:hypothetical protein [Massilia consociata]|uniref:DUF2268 domain-containing protein n=1 Tax=Massilia consociata TaxID=760117 RepID=A0ABV6FCX9_9BURK